MGPLLTIRFPGLDQAAANMAARELCGVLADASTDVSARVVKDDQTTMDIGSVVEIVQFVASTAASAAMGEVFSMWLLKRKGVSIELEGHGVRASNLTSQDAVKIAQIFSGLGK